MLGLPRWFHRWASPPHVYELAERWRPWLGGLALLTILGGAYGGLVLAPPDYLQGDSFRIIYVHVPSAYLSMMGYTLMAVAAAIGFVWRIKLADAVAGRTPPHGPSVMFLPPVPGGPWRP